MIKSGRDLHLLEKVVRPVKEWFHRGTKLAQFLVTPRGVGVHKVDLRVRQR